MVHSRHIATDGQPEKAMQPPHPLGVAARQVVVDGNDMHALAGQRVEVGWQRRDQRLAFARTHFGDLAVVQHHAADQLDIEVAHAEHPLAGFAHDGEGFGQQGVERLAVGHACSELIGLGTQRFVGQGADPCFQRVDLPDNSGILLDQPIIAAAENLFE